MLTLNRPLAFFDLETTGTNTAEDRIVQLAASFVNPDTENFGYHTNMLINPGIPIPASATEIHGITDEMVADAPLFSEVAKSVFNLFRNCDWAGYNIKRFDVPLLINELGRCGYRFKSIPAIIDVFQIFKEQVPHTLAGAVAHYLGTGYKFDAHDAAADTKATASVFFKQIEIGDYPNTVDGLANHFRAPGELDLAGKLRQNEQGNIELCFGKYKGVELKDVPDDYMRWCRSNDVFGPDAWDIIKEHYRRRRNERLY